MYINGFEWDDGNWPKCGEHGLSRGEIESVLKGEMRIFDDPFNPDVENDFALLVKVGQKDTCLLFFALGKSITRY